jgi:hypothetical protein
MAMIRGCDNCEVLVINGVAAHESGCPNAWLDPSTGRPYLRECSWCGNRFEPDESGQELCDEECASAYGGW